MSDAARVRRVVCRCGHGTRHHHGENVVASPGPCHATVYTPAPGGWSAGANAHRCHCKVYEEAPRNAE